MATSRHASSRRLGHTAQLLFFLALDGRNRVKSLSLPLEPPILATSSFTRRGWFVNVALATVSTHSQLGQAVEEPMPFETSAFGRQEYTNSITASRDTNLSPAEAYDVIQQHIPPASDPLSARALDVGAGAGVSTQVLYETLGYHHIDAIDWSATAWDDSVTQQPDSVSFYEFSDDDFFAYASQRRQELYDVIVYNFAVNTSKAVTVAKRWLRPGLGFLLAPCNDKFDYWYKQSYLVLNSEGNVVWKSGQEVGAWSVQFQPDVTSQTCTGFWCGSENGYFAKRQQNYQ